MKKSLRKCSIYKVVQSKINLTLCQNPEKVCMSLERKEKTKNSEKIQGFSTRKEKKSDNKKYELYTVRMRQKPVFSRGSRDGAKFIVVLIGLVIIFKKQLTSLIQSILSKITSQSNSI